MAKAAKRKPKPETLHAFEIEELAQFLCHGSVDDDMETGYVDSDLYDKYDITLESFEKLVRDLWPLLTVGVSPLTDTPFVGFSNENEGTWIVKKDVTRAFVNGVIQWLGANEIGPGCKGFARDVSKAGKPEFTITITPAKAKGTKPIKDNLKDDLSLTTKDAI